MESVFGMGILAIYGHHACTGHERWVGSACKLVPITTLPMALMWWCSQWHSHRWWCGMANASNAKPGWRWGRSFGRSNNCHYYGRRLQRRLVHHRQVELPGLHVQRAPNWLRHPNIGPEHKTVCICMYEWQSIWGAPCQACACQVCLPTSSYLLFK